MNKKKTQKKTLTKQSKDWYVEWLESQGVIVNKKGEIVGVPTNSRYSREYDY